MTEAGALLISVTFYIFFVNLCKLTFLCRIELFDGFVLELVASIKILIFLNAVRL